MIEKKLRNLPIYLILSISILALYGVLVLYSAAGNNMGPWASKQLTNFILFMIVAIIIAIIDINSIFRYAYILYTISLILLICVYFFGVTAMGARRWIEIIGIRLQPSELAKIAVVIALSRIFHIMGDKDITNPRMLLKPLIALILPAAFIIKQPDLGTGLLMIIVGISIFFVSGVEMYKFIIVFAIIIVCMPVIWTFLYDYQKQRILTFLNPESDPLGNGYNIIQSKIAIGSGGICGKGIGAGTQSHLDFLPEHQTDFIFASLAEEMGFLGVAILFMLYFIVIYLTISIATNARNVFSKLLVIGILSIFFCHIFINIAMVVGLLPAVGIPLPFISYGGTMIASMLCGFGIVMNVHVNRTVKLVR